MSLFFQYQFIQNAIIASFFASIVCGIIGVVIVEKKLVMMSGGIAHTSYGGVGLGYLMGFEPIIGAFFISICAAFGISYINRKGGTQSDVVIGLLWSLGMALGILFIALMPGYPPDLTSYLFGSILSVTRSDIYLMAVLTLLVFLVIILLFNYWKSFMFDEEYASIMGIKTSFLEYLLFVLIAMSVVVLIRVVGIILVLALFTAPTAIAGLLAKSLQARMLLSVILGSFFFLALLLASYPINISSGSTILILSLIGYLSVYTAVSLNKKLIKNKSAREHSGLVVLADGERIGE